MPKDTSYLSKSPDQNGLYSYTSEENAVWRTLFERQMEDLPGRMSEGFLSGVADLGLSPEAVPQIQEIDARLQDLSGAGVEGVPALIPPSRFFELLANRRFPVATFLRRREHLDYIEEPDLFHEVFGHCPMLTDRAFVDFIEAVGKTAVELGKAYRWPLFRLFWFTVEFGLIRGPEGLRGYGAGIASSPAELTHALSDQPEVLPFDLIEVLRTPYRIDILQPVYFAIDSFEDLRAAFGENIKSAIDEAQSLGDLPARFEGS